MPKLSAEEGWGIDQVEPPPPGGYSNYTDYPSEEVILEDLWRDGAPDRTGTRLRDSPPVVCGSARLLGWLRTSAVRSALSPGAAPAPTAGEQRAGSPTRAQPRNTRRDATLNKLCKYVVAAP